MEEKRDAMDKLVEAAYEYADERIMEIQDLYRKKAEGLVEKINQYRAWAEDDNTSKKDSSDFSAMAFGIEEALEALGFKVLYSFVTRKTHLITEV